VNHDETSIRQPGSFTGVTDSRSLHSRRQGKRKTPAIWPVSGEAPSSPDEFHACLQFAKPRPFIQMAGFRNAGFISPAVRPLSCLNLWTVNIHPFPLSLSSSKSPTPSRILFLCDLLASPLIPGAMMIPRVQVLCSNATKRCVLGAVRCTVPCPYPCDRSGRWDE